MRYTKKKAQILLHTSYSRFQRKRDSLSPETQKKGLELMRTLQDAIEADDKVARKSAQKVLQAYANQFLRRSVFTFLYEHTVSLILVILLALLIRPMVFELYDIPTGSMRPTLLEQDRVYVSKAAYGINIPLTPKQFYFDPDLLRRNDCVAFTGENLDIPNVDVMNFYIIPAKKQLVKRAVAGPGDTVYFYGGKIYGVDKDGQSISHLLNFKNLTHIPFMTFEGKVETPHAPENGIFSPITLKQYNIPVATLTALSQDFVTGKLLPIPGKSGKRTLAHYDDMWGMHNFGQTRLLTNKQYKSFSNDLQTQSAAFLEIRHHPSLKGSKVQYDAYGRPRPVLHTETSYLPINETHLKTIFNHMTTERFTVKNEKLAPYSYLGREAKYERYYPKVSGMPDGTYEFQDGRLYKVGFSGFRSLITDGNPLLEFSVENTFLLYNLGENMFTPYMPHSKEDPRSISRYAYYRFGSLYLLDHPVLDKKDKALINFVQREHILEKTHNNYKGFYDQGEPSQEDIAKNGLYIPEGHYLALGDNYAGSADSREFGFLPQENIRGAPTLIFWPINSTWGRVPSPDGSTVFTFPHIFLWTIVLVGWFGYVIYARRMRSRHLTIE